MKSNILTKVDDQLQKYKNDHPGQKPLFILVSPHEADDLLKEVKQAGGYSEETLVTEYKGSKIVKFDALKNGDMRLSDELPETSS